MWIHFLAQESVSLKTTPKSKMLTQSVTLTWSREEVGKAVDSFAPL